MPSGLIPVTAAKSSWTDFVWSIGSSSMMQSSPCETGEREQKSYVTESKNCVISSTVGRRRGD